LDSTHLTILYIGTLDDAQRKRIESASPGIVLHQAPNPAAVGEIISEVEVVAAPMVYFPRDLFLRARKLKWLHALSAGVDAMLHPELIASPVQLSNSRGVFDIPVSEHAFMLLTALTRGLPLYAHNQSMGLWKRGPASEMEGKTIGIIGLGSIGRMIAQKAKLAYGMKVVATQKPLNQNEPNVDVLLPAEELDRLMQMADFVVVATALTEETEGMIGTKELRLMKPTAYLVNIARGKIIQNQALIQALREHWIAGAGLDVADPEPLPPDSELWQLDNLILTPHIASVTDPQLTSERMITVFLDNLRAYRRGEPLPTFVDKERRY
jgi:D-2-hydroxyacid dehydrogenase (NADP+)